jgi:sigma-B regulation protein RsbU (phosphoserine phosphatase)
VALQATLFLLYNNYQIRHILFRGKMIERDTPESGHRFALLYQLSQTFNASLNLAEVLDRVMDEVVKTLKAERGFVALRGEKGELDFRSARGMDQTTIDHPEFEISRGIVDQVCQTGEGVHVSDAQMDDRFSSRHSVLNLKLRSILCAPLKLKDTILGVIYIDNRIYAGIFTEDDLDLLKAIAASAAIAIENARLYEVAVEKGRMERELQMAYRVQSSLIPKEMPQIHGWEFAACWRPARQVSGDFYDFSPAYDGQWNFIIADVTDKGMPAALFMALTRSLVRSNIYQARTLSDGITRANRLICEDSTISMPVTLFVCQLDPNTGDLTYVNAGHNPPMFYSVRRNEIIELSPTGMFMGFDNEAVYRQESLSLASGDFIICYTDGVLDAINVQKEAFEIGRFKKVIKENLKASAMEMINAIELSILEFIGEIHPYDDLTILILRRTGEVS